jgi:hypothetical protein
MQYKNAKLSVKYNYGTAVSKEAYTRSRLWWYEILSRICDGVSRLHNSPGTQPPATKIIIKNYNKLP